MNTHFNALNDHEILLDLALMNAVQNRIDSGSLPHTKINVFYDPEFLQIGNTRTIDYFAAYGIAKHC